MTSFAGPLDLAERDLLEAAQVELVEIGVETLVQAPLGVEDVGGDEGRRVVALGLEHLGHGHELGGDDEAAVVPDAVEEGQGAGHDRRVRGQGQGRLARWRVSKRMPRAAKVSMVGVATPAIAVAADLVGPERIHGDQDDVEVPASAQAAEIRRPRTEKKEGGEAPDGDKGGPCQQRKSSFGHWRGLS